MGKFLSTIAAGALALTLAACGGGDALDGTATTSGTTGTGTTTGGTTPSTTYSMGNGSGSSFQSGVIGISSTSVSAGGTTSLTVTIVDSTGTLYTGASVTVDFNSPCVANGLATITASGTNAAGTTADTVITSTGSATAIYTAQGCSGSDVITATATVASATLTATGTVTVAAAAVGSIQFESASPSEIGLKGTGIGETSTVIFKVVDSTGGARPGVDVSFALNTTVGGLSISPTTATSASDGTVQTVVSSGTVHTTVRVTASIATPALSTQSSVLTVTTGLPASAGFSISVGAPSYASSGLACPNVEAWGVDGVVVPITVRLSDRYNNPAPNGTAVTFTTDGGHVDGSCVTPSAAGANDGTCSVNWTSANPRPVLADDNPPLLANGRAQVLATAIGEESFTDVNGTGFWQTGDPFSNLGEPYRDDNENGQYDSGEYFLDFNGNHMYDGPPSPPVFKGIECTGTTSGSTCTTTTLAIGIEHLVIMSTSAAQILISPALGSASGFSQTGGVLHIPHSTTSPTVNNTGTLSYTVLDNNNNPMAAGTTIAVTADSSIGQIGGTGTSWTIGCRSGAPTSGNPAAAGDTLPVTLTAGTTPGSSGNITITVTSPGTKTVTVLAVPVVVD